MNRTQYMIWLASQASEGLTYLWPVTLVLISLVACGLFWDVRSKRLRLDGRLFFLFLPGTGIPPYSSFRKFVRGTARSGVPTRGKLRRRNSSRHRHSRASKASLDDLHLRFALHSLVFLLVLVCFGYVHYRKMAVMTAPNYSISRTLTNPRATDLN